MADKIVGAYLLEIGKPTPTGRIYSKEVIEPAIEKFNDLQLKAVVCHPDDSAGGMPVNMSHVSHNVDRVYIEDNIVKMDAHLLATPMGNIVKGLIDGGVHITYYPCGVGRMEEDGNISEYELLKIAISTNTGE